MLVGPTQIRLCSCLLHFLGFPTETNDNQLIQASKDKYKSDVEKAMSFDRTMSKPPIIRDKLPRPDATPLISRRQERRQEREATVISAIVTDRAKRGKSDDLLRSSTFRF